MGVQGLFVSRAGIFLVALAVLVIIPMLLVKAGIENAYTDLLANAFTSFAIIFIIGVIALHRYIRANIVAAGILLCGIAIAAYLYVYTLIM